MKLKPKISIIMPVYDPDPSEFKDAIDSILWQVYPHWELCIVDDLSTNRDYIKVLGKPRDRRIGIHLSNINRGIVGASQIALKKATGEYIAFMDQDDVLYPDALYSFVKVLQSQDIDFFYSDRDMISPQGKRYMHFFKPGWSPEYLLSFNYVRHFEIYRKSILQDAGGLRSTFEGSQDYDLALRVGEKTDKIVHYPMILYSWRQSHTSIAKNSEIKSYVYDAGIKAVDDALRRRNLPVREVFEEPLLWRGHYRIKWDDAILSKSRIFLIIISRDLTERDRLTNVFKDAVDSLDIDFISTDYKTENMSSVLKSIPDEAYLLFCDDTVLDIVSLGLSEMLGYLHIDGVGAVGCKFLDKTNKVFNVGISLTSSEKVLFSYRGSPVSDHGYGAVASVPRNVSQVFPAFWGSKASTIKKHCFFQEGESFHGLSVNFFIQLIKSNQRVVCIPYMSLKIDTDRFNYNSYIKVIKQHWKAARAQDNYYNPNLTDAKEDYGIGI